MRGCSWKPKVCLKHGAFVDVASIGSNSVVMFVFCEKFHSKGHVALRAVVIPRKGVPEMFANVPKQIEHLTRDRPKFRK